MPRLIPCLHLPWQSWFPAPVYPEIQGNEFRLILLSWDHLSNFLGCLNIASWLAEPQTTRSLWLIWMSKIRITNMDELSELINKKAQLCVQSPWRGNLLMRFISLVSAWKIDTRETHYDNKYSHYLWKWRLEWPWKVESEPFVRAVHIFHTLVQHI